MIKLQNDTESRLLQHMSEFKVGHGSSPSPLSSTTSTTNTNGVKGRTQSQLRHSQSVFQHKSTMSSGNTLNPQKDIQNVLESIQNTPSGTIRERSKSLPKEILGDVLGFALETALDNIG